MLEIQSSQFIFQWISIPVAGSKIIKKGKKPQNVYLNLWPKSRSDIPFGMQIWNAILRFFSLSNSAKDTTCSYMVWIRKLLQRIYHPVLPITIQDNAHYTFESEASPFYTLLNNVICYWSQPERTCWDAQALDLTSYGCYILRHHSLILPWTIFKDRITALNGLVEILQLADIN